MDQPPLSPGMGFDVILAAQALSFGTDSGEVIPATTNPKHLNQFVSSKSWGEIL